MTLQQLEYIIAIDDYRQFILAADKCFVTQPTLTMGVKKLEDELGVEIFDRNRKPVVPTPVGLEIINMARNVVGNARQITEFVRREKDEMKGEIRIGVLPTLAPYVLPLFIPDFIRSYPGMDLNIREMNSLEMIVQLKTNQLDVGLVVTPLEETELMEFPIFNEPFLVYAHPESKILTGGKISQADLNNKDLLLLSEGHCFRNQTLSICKLDQPLKKGLTFESGSLEAIKGLVNRGLGFTLVPMLAVSASERSQVASFKAPIPVREVSLVMYRTFFKRKLVEEISRLIKENLPKEVLDQNDYFQVKWREK
jgi:LysR family hydrogen peroxide-inducible transcriptional activator